MGTWGRRTGWGGGCCAWGRVFRASGFVDSSSVLGTGSRCFVLALPVVCSLKRRECQSQQYGLFLCMKKSPQKTSDNVYKNMKGCQDVLSSENLKGKKLQKSISHMNWFVKSQYVCVSINTSHRWAHLNVRIWIPTPGHLWETVWLWEWVYGEDIDFSNYSHLVYVFS